MRGDPNRQATMLTAITPEQKVPNDRPIRAILATHPLKRLRHAGRVFVAGAQDPKVPEHVGFIPTATVEDAIAEAERIHGHDCSIVCLEQAMG